MGRPEESLQRDGSPEREFAFWLRDLRNHAGLTYARLARATNYSTSTMQAAASGRQLPTMKVVMAFVAACGGDEEAWERYWFQVKRALDSDAPPGSAWPIRPEWAPNETTPAGQEPAGRGAPRVPAAADHSRPGDQTAAQPSEGAHAPRPVNGTQPSSGSDCADGWYVESFAALLRMDTPQPEAVEDRVIVATRDDVRELATSISLPRHPDDSGPVHTLDAELLYGGSLELREQPFETYFRNVIALAQPLKRGDRHEYRLRLRVPEGQPMAPHYVYVPFQRTDHFKLRIRFSPQRIPQKVWVLSGTPPAIIYERRTEGATLTPDRFGEVSVEFHGLLVGHGYGVRWQDLWHRPDTRPAGRAGSGGQPGITPAVRSLATISSAREFWRVMK